MRGRFLVSGVLALVGGAVLTLSVAAQTDGTGSIAGTVKTNSVPNLPPLEPNKNQDYCGEQLASDAVVADAAGQLRYAVVHLDAVEYSGTPEPTPLVVSNDKCAFSPHVQAGMVRSTLEVTSSDPILHNTHLFLISGSREKSLINLALPGEGARLDASRAMRRPGVVEMKCDAHKWMSGYILLFDHPYYAVSDTGGNFVIDGVPPGTYTIKVWHETFGELAKEVTVEAGEATPVSFEFMD